MTTTGTYPVQSIVEAARVTHVLTLRVATPRRCLGDATVGTRERLRADDTAGVNC